jgi:osmoprotectant transport system ATP-binding protein
MPAAGITFANVSYAPPPRAGQPARTLLRDISLTLEPGATTALLGRSGSGKTTLLRMVNGLASPTSGTVLVDGKSTQQYDPQRLRRSIGYVIQETGLFPHMTVERNAGLALELGNPALAGQSVQQRAARTAEVLALAGLDFAEFRARYPWQLSGGQRQRVGLARALATDPGVLLMDEPFGALDPLTRAEMQSMLRDLLARVGKTVLLVTHDLDEALFLAQRIVFLDAGQIVADLPAADVLNSPNLHVRAYISAVHRTTDSQISPGGHALDRPGL